MTGTDIDAIRPATDLLIANLRETVGEVQAHEHPKRGGDLYCLNLTSYMGDRMGPVLRRLADEQAEKQSWKDRHTALADEFTAEVDRLNAELEQTRAALTASRENAANLANEVGALKAELERMRAGSADAGVSASQCQYGYPRGGDSPDWCRLRAGHTGLHKGDGHPIGFTDAGTVKRTPEVAG